MQASQRHVAAPAYRFTPAAIAIHAALLVAGLLVAFPFVWMLLTALKTTSQALAFPPVLLPKEPQWGNFADAWSAAPFGRYFANTLFVAGSVTLSVVITALLAGYAFGQLEFPGKQPLFALYLATLMIPFEVVLIPNFLTIGRLGWYDTYAAMIVPWGANVFSVFLLTQFFRTLPRDFFEAAQLDGGGHWQYLWSVAAPLARPVLATAGLFAFLGELELAAVAAARDAEGADPAHRGRAADLPPGGGPPPEPPDGRVRPGHGADPGAVLPHSAHLPRRRLGRHQGIGPTLAGRHQPMECRDSSCR
jgi:multiple sugar transport system permease protein